MQEVHKDFVYLPRIGDSLSVFILPSSLVNQVTLLARGITRKDKTLASAHTTLSTMKASLSADEGDLEKCVLTMPHWLKN